MKEDKTANFIVRDIYREKSCHPLFYYPFPYRIR